MIGKEVKDSRPISVQEALEILEKSEKSGKGALTYEQQIALEHAKKFSAPKAKAEKMRKALDALGTLSLRAILKIVEIGPRNMMLLRQILMKEDVDEDTIKKALAIVKENS